MNSVIALLYFETILMEKILKGPYKFLIKHLRLKHFFEFFFCFCLITYRFEVTRRISTSRGWIDR